MASARRLPYLFYQGRTRPSLSRMNPGHALNRMKRGMTSKVNKWP